jgi:hypothetical protein
MRATLSAEPTFLLLGGHFIVPAKLTAWLVDHLLELESGREQEGSRDLDSRKASHNVGIRRFAMIYIMDCLG